MKRSQLRGYALLMVLMVLSLIALGLGTVMYVVDANLTTTRRILGETRCFYAVDSASRLASGTVQAVSATLPPDSSGPAVTQAIADAMAAVCSIAGGCSGTPPLPTGLMPQGVTMTKFVLKVTPTTGFRFVSTGPFRGIVIRESGMSVFIEGRDDGTGRECHVLESFLSGTVSPFQFMMFSTGPASFFTARSNRASPVPVYGSGDLCVGGASGATLNLSRIGSGGVLRAAGTTPCPPTGGTVELLGAGFTLPDGIAAFENQQPALALPIATTPNMQGSNRVTSAGQVLTTRWLIDPVIKRVDNQAEERMRLAGVADVRIIDGVWYVKRQGFAWPGMPIYSDHPGSVTPQSTTETAELLMSASSSSQKVGLDDVRAVLEAAGERSAGDAWPPTLFSWYETNASGALNDGGEGGVTSYGPLKRDGSGALVPGFYVGGSNTCGLAGTALIAVTDGACSGGERYRALAEGSRSGFGDFSAESTATSSRRAQTKVAPINFNVAKFVEALGNTNVSELGHYFQGRQFNGVVYITSTWKGQLTGLVTSSPSPLSSVVNPEQAPTGLNPSILSTITGKITSPTISSLALALASTVQADSGFFLPHNLCGSASGGAAAPDSYAPGFAISPCDGLTPFGAEAYGSPDGREGARPNAVRVFNGGDLRMFQPGAGEVTKAGLSIVTNLPLYVQGDYNTQRRVAGGNFPRAMLAGNNITVLSNAWDDDQNGWSDVMTAGFTPPSATSAHSVDDSPSATSTSMMLRAAVISHSTRSGQGNEELIRNLETFSGPITLRGALYVAGHSVFRNDTQETSSLGRPALDFRYDTTFAQPSLQPAGIPKFLIGVAGRWKDTR